MSGLVGPMNYQSPENVSNTPSSSSNSSEIVSHADTETPEQSVLKCEKYAKYMVYVLHYLQTDCYAKGVSPNTRKAIRKATSKGQYSYEGTCLLKWNKFVFFNVYCHIYSLTMKRAIIFQVLLCSTTTKAGN